MTRKSGAIVLANLGARGTHRARIEAAVMSRTLKPQVVTYRITILDGPEAGKEEYLLPQHVKNAHKENA